MKHLRYLAVHPEPEVQAGLSANTNHLCWMYEHYALPYLKAGVSKINVHFVAQEQEDASVSEVLEIVDVRMAFDVDHHCSLSPEAQQRYYLDRFHAALLRCGNHFGWEVKHFNAARERMLADELKFSIRWKKPLFSPDRRHKVQGVVEAAEQTKCWLAFFDRSGNEVQRSLLSVTATGSFDLRFIYNDIRWLDNDSIRVTQDNGRDYWICTVDGRVEFHYPRAEQGDPQAEFALGRMYYAGLVVVQDRQRGLELLHSAATKGDKHAVNYLRRIGSGEVD